MLIKKVLLINLPEEGACADFYTPSYTIGSFSTYPPLGLLYIATAIKDKYPVEIIDTVALKYSTEEIAKKIIEKNPDVLGISIQTMRLYPAFEILNKVKKELKNTITIIGGPHTAIYPFESLNLPHVDYVINGDGEYPLLNLLDALSQDDFEQIKSIKGLILKDKTGQIIQNPPNYQPINEIAIPDRSLLDYKYYYTAADDDEQVVTMISSRGCPFRCIFCDVQEKRYRARSAESVVDEMEYISQTFSNPIIHVFDDNFNLFRDRVLEICEEIQKRNLKLRWTTRARVHPLDEEMIINLKKAGLIRIHLGVESGSEKSLKLMRKGIKKEQIINAFKLCKKYEIDTLAYFIIGYSWETKKDINATLKFIKKISPDFILACTLYPCAKTDVYNELLKTGVIDRDYWQEFVTNPIPNFKLPQYRNLKTKRYLDRKLDEIYLKFYCSPSFVWKNLTSKKKNNNEENNKSSIAGLFFKVKLAFMIILSYLKNLFLEFIVFTEKNEIK